MIISFILIEILPFFFIFEPFEEVRFYDFTILQNILPKIVKSSFFLKNKIKIV
jgi:hypothetical protein